MIAGKVVVITGGAGLLGIEFVKSIVEHEGIAIIADINENVGTKKLREIAKITQKNTIDFFKLDITCKSSIESIINYTSQKYGKIDTWVNNAYAKISSFDADRKREFSKSFFDIDVDELCESVSLNIGAYFLCSQMIARHFIIQGYGNIINVSSIYGVIAPRFEIYNDTKMVMPVDYALIKSSLIHFTKYLAKYLKNSNIRVNTISPGGVFNNQPNTFVNAYNKLALNKGMLDEEDVCGILLFLISDYSTCINGRNIIVDDGWTL